MQLGQDFMRKIGRRLKEADLYLAGAGKLALAEHRAKTKIPDDEPLLLHGIAGKDRVNLRQDIYTVKRDGRLMISLGDFANAAELAISVDADKGTAAGWFIREDQRFSLDAGKKEATIIGKTIPIPPEDIEVDGRDILVSAETLEKWFGLSFDYNFSDLALIIATAQPLPVEESWRRGQYHSSRIYSENKASLPQMATPYEMLSQPYVDATVGANWSRSPGSEPVKGAQWSSIISGDVLGFNAQTFASGSARVPYLSTARFTLGQQDTEGNLLGPLHATSFQFGDVTSVSPPLIGGGAQEQGFIAGNRPLYTSTQTTTEISGDALPGWDVELYRNDSRIDIRRVDKTGRYVFETVDLIVGDNDFKLLFYGPHGEIREEHRHIGVLPSQLSQQKGYYSASITRNNLTTWQREKPTGPGTGDINLAATYEKGIGPLGTASLGIRRRSDQGEQRVFTQAGLASYFLDTFFNTDVGYDVQQKDNTAAFSARHNFGRQSALLQYTWASENYNVAAANTGGATKNTFRSSLSGPLFDKLLFLDRTNYTFSSTYSDYWNDIQQYGLSSGLSTRIGSNLLSAGFQYNRNIDENGAIQDSSNLDTAGRGFAFGGIWRLESSYELKPIMRLIKHNLEYSYDIGNNIDLASQIEYKPDPSYTRGALSVNWRLPKATVSPRIETDTLRNLQMGVDVHFGLGADPFSKRYDIYNAYMADAGGVAARVFLDKNGNGYFDKGDELMPEVMVKALQAHRSAISDESGVAFIPDLQKNHLTDIVVDPATFKDSYNISLFEGVSVSPHPGSVAKIEFPVVVAGEMDGQAGYSETENAQGKNIEISLVAPDGTVEKSSVAAFDGYWSLSTIRPGIYYLVATPDEGSAPGYLLPKTIAFDAMGSTYFGQNVALKLGHSIDFRFRSENKAPSAPRHARVILPGDIESQKILISLGRFHSRLAMAFTWYKFRILGRKWNAYLRAETPVSQIKPDPKTSGMPLLLRATKPLTMERAAATCEKLQDIGFDCSVEVVTRYKKISAPPDELTKVSKAW